MKSDAIIKIRFKTTAEGGRQGAVVGKFYGCPLFVDGEEVDVALEAALSFATVAIGGGVAQLTLTVA
jgi:hypothetical protein